MIPGTKNIPAMVRGDTFQSRIIATLTEDEVPVVVTRARLQIRTRRDNTLIYEWNTDTTANASISGTNAITLNAVLPAVTETWLTGNHPYELEVDTTLYGTITLLSGTIEIRKDINLD
jgi:hypothetical protein